MRAPARLPAPAPGSSPAPPSLWARFLRHPSSPLVAAVAFSVCVTTLGASGADPQPAPQSWASAPTVSGPAAAGVTAGTADVAAPAPKTQARRPSRGTHREQGPVTARWTGYAFDACRAPSSRVMDRWRVTSPFLGVGIYIGGALRACEQRHLTPRWVSHQTRQGWRLLPIWVGPQASCAAYRKDIASHPGRRGLYPGAHRQGVRAAKGAKAAARALGIRPGSTLWYDLEWFPPGNVRCRDSALRLLSSWTRELHRGGYQAGVYSSISAGIKAVGKERGRDRYTSPDHVWFAWANGRRDTWFGTDWLRAPRWKQNRRVHQYALDVTASYGGVRMRIDRNYVDLGTTPHVRRTPAVCGRAADEPRYRVLHRGSQGSSVAVAQCLLRATGHYRGETGSTYGEVTRRAVRSFQRALELPGTGRVDKRTWTALLAAGPRQVLKRGSEGTAVRRVQRALTSALPGSVAVHGHFGPATQVAVSRYQRRAGLDVTGVVSPATWRALRTGRLHDHPVRHGHKAGSRPHAHGKHDNASEKRGTRKPHGKRNDGAKRHGEGKPGKKGSAEKHGKRPGKHEHPHEKRHRETRQR